MIISVSFVAEEENFWRWFADQVFGIYIPEGQFCVWVGDEFWGIEFKTSLSGWLETTHQTVFLSDPDLLFSLADVLFIIFYGSMVFFMTPGWG